MLYLDVLVLSVLSVESSCLLISNIILSSVKLFLGLCECQSQVFAILNAKLDEIQEVESRIESAVAERVIRLVCSESRTCFL
jgi:hypothetical protein